MHRRLTLRQVEAFRAVMLRGSISGAAEMLSLTQPAVSRLMRDIQDGLTLRLFEPRDIGIVSNAEANLLFEDAQRSFLGLDRIEHTAQEIKRARRGNLRIIAMAGPAHGILPRLIGRFIADHPDIFVAASGIQHALRARGRVRRGREGPVGLLGTKLAGL